MVGKLARRRKTQFQNNFSHAVGKFATLPRTLGKGSNPLFPNQNGSLEQSPLRVHVCEVGTRLNLPHA